MMSSLVGGGTLVPDERLPVNPRKRGILRAALQVNLGRTEHLFTWQPANRDIFIRGTEGALSPLNFYNPKRFEIWYVMRIAITWQWLNAKVRQSIFGYFINRFWMFCEISGPLSQAAYIIVDLLIKIPGPLNSAAYWKVHNFFKRSKICQKRSKISKALCRFNK